MADGPTLLRQRLLAAIGLGGVFTAGFATGRVTAPVASTPAPITSSSSSYVRQPPGTYPAPPASHNACYAAGTKTAPLPCLERVDPQLPMLLGQCNHPATDIQDGPSLAQYAGSPAVICCYRAIMPTCSGRPLHVGSTSRLARLQPARAWC